jgi:dephospho-CoA kinase
VDTQRERVMARGGMTDEIFKMILSRQLPDAEKRERADYVIETKSLDHVRDEVHRLIVKLIGALPDA